MDAYYSYQIINSKNKVRLITFDLTKNLKLPSNIDLRGGMKFLESFYHQTAITQCLYFILKSISKESDGAVINTVCDYDLNKDFKERMNFYGKTIVQKSFNEKELKNFICGYYTGDVKGITGYIYCKELKQYIDLKKFQNENFILSPIALLTRSSAETKGGGDFSELDLNPSKEEYREFKENKLFDIGLVSAWKDKKIKFISRKNKFINAYEDISEKVYLESIY